MDGGTFAPVARFAAAAAAGLLLVDLFLDWQRAAVRVAGVVEVEATAAGWHGWGFLAGVLALALMAVLLTAGGRSTVSAAVALGMLAATTVAVVTSEPDVAGGPAASVEESTVWPAWLGLVLAAVAFVATLVPLLTHPETPQAGAPTSAV